MPCGDLAHVIHMAHSHLAYKHAAALQSFFPTAFENRALLFVPEGNTFDADVNTLMINFSNTCNTLLNKRPSLYCNKYSRYGFITTAETKVAAASILAGRIKIDTLLKFNTILSFSEELRAAFADRDRSLDREIIQIKSRDEWGADNDPLNYLANPSGVHEIDELPAVDRVRFFKVYGGISLPLGVCNGNITQGATMFEELCDQMSRVVLDDTTKIPHIRTGGKQYVKGTYTRDDLYSALSIAALLGESHMYGKCSWVTI
ncbi:hypothetical protein [Ranid herpesvirus 3]|uniref:Uncharacterized protein n=1 Tax=Ranid herpesvirus 3 TaxID=1987509 RepID=A0A1X9T5E7_9VIRU|nr:hypothetical protein [Ranid herpesvirus 3]ARR28928.1 hypothetical protein [Ranid herpesvirus 3]